MIFCEDSSTFHPQPNQPFYIPWDCYIILSYNVVHLARLASRGSRSIRTNFGIAEREALQLRPFKGEVVAPFEPNGSGKPNKHTIFHWTWSRRAKLYLQRHFPDIFVSASANSVDASYSFYST
jgi:hypothetical protein